MKLAAGLVGMRSRALTVSATGFLQRVCLRMWVTWGSVRRRRVRSRGMKMLMMPEK